MVGLLTSRDLIHGDRRYFFSKCGRFLLAYVFWWNYFLHNKPNSTVRSSISTEISNYPPPHHHQVNYKLTCCHNYEGYEGGKSGQDEDRGGVFRYGKGRRDGRYQRGRKQKDEEVDVGMCTVIIMILKDVSQHGVSVPNNIGGNYPLAGIHVDIDGKSL